MPRYVHQTKDWPEFLWDNDLLLNLLGEVRNLQGKLVGKMEALGFDFREKALLKTLTLDVLKSSEIEGEIFKIEEVRSSLAKKLGMDLPDLVPYDRNIDGVADVLVDATRNNRDLLTEERLFSWHAALFPTGRSGMHKITVGDWRQDEGGPMQVVSGAMGKEFVHFEAPASKRVPEEMEKFITWFNEETQLEPVLKAAVAHFWFITIHPFDDGNGRIARALTDMLLARADGINQRFYSMSAQIRLERKRYYAILETCQKSSIDITSWMVWFLECLQKALKATDGILADVLQKSDFWRDNMQTQLNERQHKMLNKVLDGFDGKLTSSKWAKMCKCSTDTALRDIQDLISKGILKKEESGGRSSAYELK
ncbi:MAG: Fic family protein [Bacteroidota bacterium]